jgi:hypothetical protein
LYQQSCKKGQYTQPFDAEQYENYTGGIDHRDQYPGQFFIELEVNRENQKHKNNINSRCAAASFIEGFSKILRLPVTEKLKQNQTEVAKDQGYKDKPVHVLKDPGFSNAMMGHNEKHEYYENFAGKSNSITQIMVIKKNYYSKICQEKDNVQVSPVQAYPVINKIINYI